MFRGEHINTSLNFVSNPNLHYALGKVDILDMHINKEGDIEAYVLDTYDFNKNSKSNLVQKGRLAQEYDLINNYYSLIKVVKKL